MLVSSEVVLYRIKSGLSFVSFYCPLLCYRTPITIISDFDNKEFRIYAAIIGPGIILTSNVLTNFVNIFNINLKCHYKITFNHTLIC